MDQGIDFSNAKHREELHGYIPQTKIEGFVYPLLACDVGEIDEDILSWKDPHEGYLPHSLVEDVKTITGYTTTRPIFSIVKQWQTRPGKAPSSHTSESTNDTARKDTQQLEQEDDSLG